MKLKFGVAQNQVITECTVHIHVLRIVRKVAVTLWMEHVLDVLMDIPDQRVKKNAGTTHTDKSVEQHVDTVGIDSSVNT